MVSYKVMNKLEFSPISETHFSGRVEEFMMRYLKHRVLSDFAKNTIFAEAEDAIINPVDDATVVGFWSGEFWGKLSLSACRVYEYTKDEELKKFLHESAHRIIDSAREDGYIGSYKDSANVIATTPEEALKATGQPWPYNWNIWCRKYILWGLIECAQVTEDESVLMAAHKLAIQLITELEEKSISLRETGYPSFRGMPSSSILKPMLILYRLTEDERLLNFAISIAEDWDREDDLSINLIRNALEKKPIHEWQSHPESWAKAYEMMSCMDGLIELYRVTGTEKYVKAVQNLVEMMEKYEETAIGSVGLNDIFSNASQWINLATEPCDVIHWIRVNSELAAFTGEAKYMDTVEKSFYNAFLAGISADGKWVARCVRSSGRHMNATGQCGREHNHCCADNIPRGYMNVTSSAVMVGEDGYYINQFCPFESIQSSGKVIISCSEGYLENGKCTITVKADAPISLYIRVPAHAGKHVSITGVTMSEIKAGNYVSISTKAGETVIAVDFDYRAVVNDFRGEVIPCVTTDNQVVRWLSQVDEDMIALPMETMMKERRSYISYGPILLACSKKVGSTEEEMFGSKSICGRGYQAQVKAIDIGESDLICRYQVKLTNDEKEINLEMCDFASAADVFLENLDPKFLNIYI